MGSNFSANIFGQHFRPTFLPHVRVQESDLSTQRMPHRRDLVGIARQPNSQWQQRFNRYLLGLKDNFCLFLFCYVFRREAILRKNRGDVTQNVHFDTV